MICSCNLVRTKEECAGIKPHNHQRTYIINTKDRAGVLHAEGVLRLCKQNCNIKSSYRYTIMLLLMQQHNIKDCRLSVIGIADKCLLNIKKVYSISYCLGVLAPIARVMHMSHIYTYYTTSYIFALIATKATASALNMCLYILSSKYRKYYIHNAREPIQHQCSTNAVLMQN